MIAGARVGRLLGPRLDLPDGRIQYGRPDLCARCGAPDAPELTRGLGISTYRCGPCAAPIVAEMDAYLARHGERA